MSYFTTDDLRRLIPPWDAAHPDYLQRRRERLRNEFDEPEDEEEDDEHAA